MTLRSGRLAPEDPEGPDDDELDDGPADESHDGRDVEDRTGCVERIRSEDALERRDEDLAEAARMADTIPFASLASRRSRTIRAPITTWISPKTRMTTRRAISERPGDMVETRRCSVRTVS